MNKKLFLKESDIGLKPAWLLFSFLFIKQINVCVKAKKKKKRRDQEFFVLSSGLEVLATAVV